MLDSAGMNTVIHIDTFYKPKFCWIVDKLLSVYYYTHPLQSESEA